MRIRFGWHRKFSFESWERSPPLLKATEDKGKSLRVECCEKYLKKGEHKRCKRCRCFDVTGAKCLHWFKDIEIDSDSNYK